jgi:hypothetical protein
MRRFFVVIFVLSLMATAGALYWRAYYPEHAAQPAPSAESSTRSLSPNDGAPAQRSPSLRQAIKSPSGRQDLAVTISILSSLVSALAAVLQTWLTARAFRRPSA